MHEIKQNIAENMIFLRKKKELTQSELAAKLNYSDKAVSKWERGEAMPDIEVLCTIAALYEISLDDLVHKQLEVDTKPDPKKKWEMGNKLIITILAILLIWMAAITIYVNVMLATEQNFWQIFIWSCPVSALVALVFNGIWGKYKYVFYIVSFMLWTLLASFYVMFLSMNMWPLFLLGAPAQIAIILWSGLRRRKK